MTKRFRLTLVAAALAGSLSAPIFALSPTPALAECAQWKVDIPWVFTQSDGIPVRLLLGQNGSHVTGDASYNHGSVLGDVEGSVVGNAINLRVKWRAGNVGDWKGTILPTGIVQGRAYDEANSSYRATFVSETAMSCADPPRRIRYTDSGFFVVVTQLPETIPLHGDIIVGHKYPVVKYYSGVVAIRALNGTVYSIPESDTTPAKK